MKPKIPATEQKKTKTKTNQRLYYLPIPGAVREETVREKKETERAEWKRQKGGRRGMSGLAVLTEDDGL